MLDDFAERTIDGTNTAVRECSQCKYFKPIDKNNPLVYEHILREDKTASLSLNPNLKHDPTLPHFDFIACSNVTCPTKSGADWNVVGKRLDDKKLVWFYQCCNCDTMWTQSANA
jgi:DNA-directed RNA polymerase subunit M/transcription elongation factor TFIIS